MNKIKILIVSGAMLCLGGCMSVSIGTDSKEKSVEVNGLASAYASLSGIEPYDDTIFEANLLGDSGRPGELAGLKLWPVGEVNIGLLGAQVKIVPFEAGIGVLSYTPQAIGPNLWPSKKKESPKKCDSECPGECK